MSKRIIALILSALLLLGLTACAGTTQKAVADEQENVTESVTGENVGTETVTESVTDQEAEEDAATKPETEMEQPDSQSDILIANTEAVLFSIDWQNIMKENGAPSLMDCCVVTDAAYICVPSGALTLTFYTVNDNDLYGVKFEMENGTDLDKDYLCAYIYGLISATCNDGDAAVKLCDDLCLSAIYENEECIIEASSDVMKASWGYSGSDYAIFAAKAVD